MGNPQLSSGTVFAGRFEIKGVAGSGGMGTVYRAHDRLSGDIVALKLLHDHGQEGGDGVRFAREAQLLSELRHPGIVGYIAHGLTPQGQRFLAMEWLDGEDLAQRLARGPLALSDALHLTRSVAEVLDFAHRHGVIHRDLKPSNLYLVKGDIRRVKILDFGMARRVAASHSMTRTGMIVGTPEYMAPEQARGSRELTPAADIFSLGCILYECLVGEAPFVAEHLATVLVRILFEEPVPLLQRRPGIPHSVAELISNMLAKAPTHRIGNAAELAAALAAISDVPDAPFLPTLAAGKAAPAHSNREQVLMSLVLAIPPSTAEPADQTVLSEDVTVEIEQRGLLLSELREMGVQADFLLGGALVVIVPQLSSATDQAALAARCATAIKEHWPEAHIAVVTGKGARSRRGLTGEVIDRAWSLLLKPKTPFSASGQIRIDEVSAGLLETRFDVGRLDDLAGVFALGNERLDPDFGRLLLGKPTPCVGRDRELMTLEAIYGECQSEPLARAVLVLGPPGMGKSRLRHEFLRRLESRGEHPVILLGRGNLMKGNSSYGVLGEALRQRLGIRNGQSLAEQRERLQARIGARLPQRDAQRVTEFFGELCGVPFPEEESPQLRAARQNPLVMSDQVEQAWVDGLRLLCTEGPILLIVEDLHWADAATVKLVGSALRQLREQAFMVLGLARPEVTEQYPNLWSSVVQHVPLHPLPSRAAERLVKQILGTEVTSEEATRMVARSAGNPLFLEELIRAAAEHKTRELPGTIAAMIQVRIGQLPSEARQALLAASVFGETFWGGGIRSLLAESHSSATVEASLKVLIHQEIIERTKERRFVNQEEFRFRHSLVREAAYGLIGETELTACHQRAGAFLEACGERDPAIIAEHYELGGVRPRAATLFSQAAVQLYERHDQQEAMSYARRAEACGVDGSERAIVLALKSILAFWQHDFAGCLRMTPEALSRLQRGSYWWCRTVGAAVTAAAQTGEQEFLNRCASELLDAQPEPAAMSAYVEALGFLANMFTFMGQVEQMSIFLKRIDELGPEVVEVDLMCRGWRSCSWSFVGFLLAEDPWMPAEMARISIDAFQAAGDQRNEPASQTTLGMALAGLGDLDAAERQLRGSVQLAERVGQPFPIAYARIHLALILATSSLESRRREASTLARGLLETSNILTLGIAHAALARVASTEENWSEALVASSRAHETLQLFPPYWFFAAPSHIYALLQLQRTAEARQFAQETMARITQSRGAGMNEIALRLAYAEALSADGATDAAHAALSTAQKSQRERTQRIPDPLLRERYLSQVPENARVVTLARAWKIDGLERTAQ